MQSTKKENSHDLYNLWFYVLVLLGIIILFGSGCTSSKVLDRGPLVRQRLQFRPNYPGLTNQTCEEFDGNGCRKMNVQVYDLRDPKIRKDLRDAKFICNVNGERFRICPVNPGLCRQEEQVTKSFLGIPLEKKYVTIVYLDQEENAQTLLNLNTWCASQESDLGRSMFLEYLPSTQSN